VKYPDLYNWEEKITEEDEELSDYRQSLRVSLKNKCTIRLLFLIFIIEIVGREGRVTTMLNKMVQTDDLEEESMEADFPFNDLDQDVQVESVPRDSV